MKLMKAVCVLVALAGVAMVAVAWARPAYGQTPAGRPWIQELILLEGPGSHLGVTARDLEPAEAERLNVEGGVFLERVSPDSPAEKAGLKASDVVVEFDGERVRSLRQFTRLVRETPPERTVKTSVLRDGRRTELSVRPVAGAPDLAFDNGRLRDRLDNLGARIWPFDFEFEIRDATARARLGVNVQDITPDLAEYFGAKDGVLVASVTADSPAARAGIRAGDVITAVNGRSVGSISDLVHELRHVTGAGDVTLGIVRDRKESTLTAKIDVQPERRARPARPFRQARPIRTPA